MKPKPRRSRAEEESIRLQGVALVLGGANRDFVAQQLGVTIDAVDAWMWRLKTYGPAGLARKHPKERGQLKMSQLPDIIHLLAAGPRHYGYPDEEWSAKAIADLLRIAYEVHYEPITINILLNKHGVPWRSVTALARLADQLSQVRGLVQA